MYGDFDYSEYYDESFINIVSKSDNKVFDYFLKEYLLKAYAINYEIKWIYPFIDKLVNACIKNKNKDRTLRAINVIINHNNDLYEQLRKTYLLCAKQYKDYFTGESYKDALNMVKRDYHIDKSKSFASLYAYHINEIEPVASNFIHLDCSSKDGLVQSKINEANEIYDKIINLPNNLIKDN